MDKFTIDRLQILKVQLSAILIMLTVVGCTSTYKIEFSVTSSDLGGVNSEDFKAISESLLNDPQIVPAIGPNEKSSGIPNRFYISRHIDAHEILTIEENDNELLLSITRLTKYLGDFSETWKNAFILKTKLIIERATNKTVDFRLLSN